MLDRLDPRLPSPGQVPSQQAEALARRRLLDHLEVGVKHNETSRFTELPESLDLAGTVVNFDALRTFRANLHWLIMDKKAHYIAIVKRNLPLLHAQVRAVP